MSYLDLYLPWFSPAFSFPGTRKSNHFSRFKTFVQMLACGRTVIFAIHAGWSKGSFEGKHSSVHAAIGPIGLLLYWYDLNIDVTRGSDVLGIQLHQLLFDVIGNLSFHRISNIIRSPGQAVAIQWFWSWRISIPLTPWRDAKQYVEVCSAGLLSDKYRTREQNRGRM